MNSANNSEVSRDSFNTTNIFVKLRRLKIEENVISRSIRKASEDFQEENYCCHEFNSPEAKGFFRNLKDCTNEIKKMFVDIKSHINSQCNLEIAGKLYFKIYTYLKCAYPYSLCMFMLIPK